MNVFIVYNVRKSNEEFSMLKTKGKDTGKMDEIKMMSLTQTQEKTSPITTNKQVEGNSRFQDSRMITSDDKQRHEAEVHLTRMLLLITTSFLVFTTPTIVRFVL